MHTIMCLLNRGESGLEIVLTVCAENIERLNIKPRGFLGSMTLLYMIGLIAFSITYDICFLE